ncbi:MAG: hypothetical protein ABSE81_07235 [Candidatus Omnitrophota bacterium]|jgi:hypothetical protein
MIRNILIILLIWAIWLGYQYQTKSQTASMLVQQKIEEFYSADPKLILQEIGQGYAYKTVEVEGKQFWMRWMFKKKDGNVIEMEGRVDFIELLPFSEFRLGHTFNSVLKNIN